jgi:hypothetical protein
LGGAIAKVASDTVVSFVDAYEEAEEDGKEARGDFTEDLCDAWSNVLKDGNSFTGILAGIVDTVGALIDLILDIVGTVVGGLK